MICVTFLKQEGGMVASSNLSVVEEFVRSKQRNSSDYKSESFYWEVAYFCLRCGLLKEAAEVTAQVEKKMPVGSQTAISSVR